MDNRRLLDWIYDYKLLAKNKKATRILYKLFTDKVDISPFSSDKQKNILRTIENKEKANPDLVANNYEELLKEKYCIDFDFSLSSLSDHYSLAVQVSDLLRDFSKAVKSLKNVPGYVLRYEVLEGMREEDSLFFKALSGIDLVSIKGNDASIHYMPDAMLYYPTIANIISQISALRNSISVQSLYAQTFVWSMAYLEFIGKGVGGDTLETIANETNRRFASAIDAMIRYADDMPIKMSYYYEPAVEAKVECKMDILYSNRIQMMALISHFTDKHSDFGHVYLCPIKSRNASEPYTAYFQDEKTNTVIEFVRVGHGHRMRIFEHTAQTNEFYIELKAVRRDNKGKCLYGDALTHENHPVYQYNPFMHNNDIRALSFKYSFDGNELTLYDEDDEEIVSIHRVQDKSAVGEIKKYVSPIHHLNAQDDSSFIARIAVDDEYVSFLFDADALRYRLPLSSDPRLKYIRASDLAYRFVPDSGDECVVIEQVGFIYAKDMEKQ